MLLYIEDDLDDAVRSRGYDLVGIVHNLERGQDPGLLISVFRQAELQIVFELLHRPHQGIVHAAYGTHRGVDLVGHARHQAAQGRHLAGLDQLGLLLMDLPRPLLHLIFKRMRIGIQLLS